MEMTMAREKEMHSAQPMAADWAHHSGSDWVQMMKAKSSAGRRAGYLDICEVDPMVDTTAGEKDGLKAGLMAHQMVAMSVEAMEAMSAKYWVFRMVPKTELH